MSRLKVVDQTVFVNPGFLTRPGGAVDSFAKIFVPSLGSMKSAPEGTLPERVQVEIVKAE